jgi:hypothetical protein
MRIQYYTPTPRTRKSKSATGSSRFYRATQEKKKKTLKSLFLQMGDFKLRLLRKMYFITKESCRTGT